MCRALDRVVAFSGTCCVIDDESRDVALWMLRLVLLVLCGLSPPPGDDRACDVETKRGDFLYTLLSLNEMAWTWFDVEVPEEGDDACCCKAKKKKDFWKSAWF